MVNQIYSGTLNRRVEIYNEAQGRDPETGEALEGAELVAVKMVGRGDGPGSDEDEYRLLDAGVCTYTMRFDKNLVDLGGTLFVRDFDGDWLVKGPARVLSGRNRYMQLKCEKRG